ncbi:hypothetical protein F0562_003204 [Nyssa sinensis]|uniref:Retrotransposon gag domain-containing protein n=1 Tax=Nyssa sinensis TaxID=561372 RepID=A0A5J5BUR0_9ASTE|nr:hypothetical protein F0562_003204 [Nyssa sinensis]
MGYSQDRWARWHNLRQRHEQIVQEYTTKFWRLAVALGIALNNEEVYTKFVASLHRSIQGHEKGKCWKLHLELFPEKWKKDEKGKRTMTVTTTSDQIELGWVEEADKTLSLMAMPKETRSSSPTTTNEKEELFNVRIQIKQEVIGAIVDTGSQKNLISTSLVQKLGLDTIPHPKPYPLGWIQKDMELKIDRQCTFWFAITNQYIDEITCEVVPINIC